MPFLSIYPNIDHKIKKMGRNLFYPRQAFSKIQLNMMLKPDCDITFHAGYDLSVTVTSEKMSEAFDEQDEEWIDIPFFDPECHPDFPKSLKGQLLAVSTNDDSLKPNNIQFVNEHNNNKHLASIHTTKTWAYHNQDKHIKIILHPSLCRCTNHKEEEKQQRKRSYADVVRGTDTISSPHRQTLHQPQQQPHIYNIFMIANMTGGLLHAFMTKETWEKKLQRIRL